MRNVEFTLFDFDDLLIEPAHISPIRSRKEINPKYDNGYYPLMTAPMDTVISKDNHKLFGNLGIRSVVPRGEGYYDQNYNDTHFNSYGLDEFNEIFINGDVEILTDSKIYVLIDIANGHMRALYDSAKTAKEKYGDKMVLMIGNVANPKTFAEYCSIGVDYIRIGIGNGGGCLTTVQTGVGFPMASLIEECYDVKKYMEFPNIKIVADGGFKSYSDIIKALALGADYVMLGSILNKSLESSGETTRLRQSHKPHFDQHIVIDQYSEEAKKMFEAGTPLFKTFRGMSTKEVQKSWGKEELKTSEGVVRTHKVEYTLEGWINNFDSYLRSAMSYTGKKELHEFIGGVQLNFISQNSYKRFSK
jgi:IMP dehydrogenase/GMP reductase